MPTLSRPTSVARAARTRTQAQVHIAQIREAMAQLDYICAGTLLRRTKRCGKPNCRCAIDPAARHGPYYEWGRLVNGRLVHTQLTPQEGERIAQALQNHRLLQRLVRRWARESVRAILAETYTES